MKNSRQERTEGCSFVCKNKEIIQKMLFFAADSSF